MRATSNDEVILLVDDDEQFRMSLKAQLEADGFQVVAAEGRRTAENLLRKIHPDLAIVNLVMEEEDAGFVLAYHIKKADPKIPVILVTASMNETRLGFDTATAEERSWIKADALVEKPLRFEQIEREIMRLLRNNVEAGHNGHGENGNGHANGNGNTAAAPAAGSAH